jgi:DNA-binding IclR family transcriptional regulator
MQQQQLRQQQQQQLRQPQQQQQQLRLREAERQRQNATKLIKQQRQQNAEEMNGNRLPSSNSIAHPVAHPNNKQSHRAIQSKTPPVDAKRTESLRVQFQQENADLQQIKTVMFGDDDEGDDDYDNYGDLDFADDDGDSDDQIIFID